ncbi:MAG: acetyl-CoA carboxylase biotin carboxylase subunit [Chromatiales bacterium]|nr:MAG: acetyl-CoA carboxylase biotin carboxylase subunit [Chromatiales bacterium]
MSAFSKILVANRGEIAVRVIRTARDLGYRTVAVYSEADVDALHVTLADQAVCIGPPGAAESYLAIEKILAAAKRSGADAIHPGYGFLAENAEFARACERAGLVFIGPGSDAIELMGSKRRAKEAMLAAGVPCIPGYQGSAQSDDVLIEKAGEIGFPVMVKASAGGGGRGLRLVTEERALVAQLKAARSEARSAFGDDELILERAIIRPRHIEIQVFADAHGNVVHVGERDCSVQRRHQKVVEEAPSPFVDEPLRRRMCEAAVQAARSCAYLGAGTVEFLVDEAGSFFFLEMNARLQVEHPVTELITGLDLVAWQLTVASGEPLPLRQDEIRFHGHAIEVRLYAEDPRRNFLPQTGRVVSFEMPQRPGVRVDAGIESGQTISPHYDPLLAKIVAFGANREIARRRLASAVLDTRLLGVNNNKAFLHMVLQHPVFADGLATTDFIAQHCGDGVSSSGGGSGRGSLDRAALLFYRRGQQHPRGGGGWRRAVPDEYTFRLAVDGETHAVRLSEAAGLFRVTVAGQTVAVRVAPATKADDGRCYVVTNELREGFAYAFDGDRVFIDDGTGHFACTNVTHAPAAALQRAGSGRVEAVMDGLIVEVLIREGEQVSRGQIIIILEAMKMEHQLRASVSGVVASLGAQAGQQVKSRQLLATIIEKTDGDE